MTRQELFDKAVRAMILQGEPAYDGGCRYCTGDGRRCAVGHLLTDEELRLTRDYPEGTINFLVVNIPAIRTAYGYEVNFLRDLQLCHDGPALDGFVGSAWLRRFIENARFLAGRMCLDDKVIDAALEERKSGESAS